MTFEKAYCEELDANITAYKIRRHFFGQEDTTVRYNFFCPDPDCNIEMTGVNIYQNGRLKHKPHFRTKKGVKHTSTCSIIKELENDGSKNAENNGPRHGAKLSKFINEFILSRPKKESNNKGPIDNEDDDFDIEPRTKRHQTPSSFHAGHKPIKTSYLENVVDCFEDMNAEERKKYMINLNGVKRSYHSTFKDIKYIRDGENFIFYGEIQPIKAYGENFSIKFKNKTKRNEEESPLMLSMYITKEVINNYRLKRLFQESMKELVALDEKTIKENPPICYFVAAYPTLKTIPSKEGSSFDVLEVNITNLDHLVIKFKE